MKHAGRFLLPLFVALAVLGAMLTLYCVCLGYYRGPFRDMWIAMDFIRPFFSGGVSFADFFALHGGAHRLAVPRAFFLVEYGVFSGSNSFLIASAVLIQLSVVALVWKLVREETSFDRNDRIFLVALALALMINTAQLENFLYTFDMQWFATSAAAIWALAQWNRVFAAIAQQHIAVAQRQTIATTALAGALIATFVSMFSSFSGLCVWLVLPVLAISYRLGATQIAGMVVVMLVIVSMYMSGPFAQGGDWTSPDMSGLTSGMLARVLFSTALRWLQWTGLYLGSPVSRWNAVAGFAVAYSSLLFLLWQWWTLLQQGTNRSTAFERVMLSIALWAAIVGIATGLGRMYFVHTAPEDRYQSIVLVYWLGLSGYLYSRTRNSKLFSAALSLIVFWSMIVIPAAGAEVAFAQLGFFDRVADANIAIATGQWNFSDIKDTLILGDKWKKISRPSMHGDFLREHRWGVFAEPDVEQLGLTLDASLIDTSVCDGQIYSASWTESPHHGLRVTGRGVDNNKHAFEQLVMVDDTNRRIGLARLERPKNFLLPRAWQDAQSSHWLGYTIDLQEQIGSVRVLGARARAGSTRYCPVATVALPLQAPE